MMTSVEDVSSSLVREYLSRKGLKRTMACLDEEHPRTEASINNRSDLRQILHMEGLYKKNKVQKNPLRTLLEMMVKHYIDLHKEEKIALQATVAVNRTNACRSPADTRGVMEEVVTEESAKDFVNRKPTKSGSSTEDADSPHCILSLPETDRLSTRHQIGVWSEDSEGQRGQQPVANIQENERFIRRDAENTAVSESSYRNRANRIRRGMMAGPIASSSQESNKKRQTRKLGPPQLMLVNEEDNRHSTNGPSVTDSRQKTTESGLTETNMVGFVREKQKSWSTPTEKWESESSFEKLAKDKSKTRQAKPSTIHQSVDDLHESAMILDDIDYNEELEELSKVCLHASFPRPSCTSHPMDQYTAVALKDVLLGSSSSCFSGEWRSQGFTFSEVPHLRYGIIQNKGGPCGVLASVQACVLKILLFEDVKSSSTDLQRLRPSNATRRQSLVSAVAEILWRAGGETQATVAVNSGSNHFTPRGRYRSEGFLEKITCLTVNNLEDLQSLLQQHIQQFESGALGCILLTISAVLSRSIERIREDMDVPTNTLIGAHGYCTQELVNLLLCGQAVSNVFDDDMELDSGNGNLTLLKGIKGHCDIGLLSLFEHYNICKVGTNLKTPRFPIWVVCSESHFSVLFSLQRELLTNQHRTQEFDLYYYDGLANQQEEIRLTVYFGMSAPVSQEFDPDLIPPLEHCIHTKWKDAVISWNDTEPIL
ncbi:probable ubiquitin carboxyl-terminal hydrolase MINDY-4 [Lampris incognitus]|uniref:probable ubiquitin carboxyl-terminal hydrolase MINDY-4 n=1 Tax=Lampris incognitus TaxID=2546036 RepID=UPI0024B5D0C0|nr:probable ubiquitin carboxyl-terminal hydrolase MINDY-4 [Lampris incognitus]